MTSPLIAGYVTGLRRDLPAAIADEAADGLIETYQQHLAAGAGDQDAARAAVTDFGDLVTVVGEFTRQAPGRRAARLLLATGPLAGFCWAAALVSSRAWTWSVPAAAPLASGAILLATVLMLLAAATSRHSYQRTRLALLAGPAIIALDAAAISCTLAAAPAFTPVLLIAMAVSVTRIALTGRALQRLTVHSWHDSRRRHASGWPHQPTGATAAGRRASRGRRSRPSRWPAVARPPADRW